MLQQLQRSLGLPQSDPTWITEYPAPHEPILVSIDCEWAYAGKSLREIGISTFDTRCLRDPSTAKSSSELFTTYSFNFQSHERFVKDKTLAFPLKNLVQVSFEDFRGVLDAFTNEATTEHDKPREKIIVGHNFNGDFRSLIQHDVSLPDAALLDTSVIRKHLDRKIAINTKFASGRRRRRVGNHHTLTAICDDLKIPFSSSMLHIGANDANLTLRVLLLMAVSSIEDLELSSKQRDTVEFIKTLALSSPVRDERKPMRGQKLRHSPKFGAELLSDLQPRRSLLPEEMDPLAHDA